MDWMPVLNLIALGCVGVFAYRTGKLNGFNLGLEYLRKKSICRSADGHEHFCNVTTCNVVCFEREGELWVKEYSAPKEREGRTYLVFYCPWCGYQTEKSKMHEKVKINIPYPRIPSAEGLQDGISQKH